MKGMMLRLRAFMFCFLLGLITVSTVDFLDRWNTANSIKLPEQCSPSLLIVIPESERNPVPYPGGSGPSISSHLK